MSSPLINPPCTLPSTNEIRQVTVYGQPRYRHHLVGNEESVPVEHQTWVDLDDKISPIFHYENWRNELWAAANHRSVMDSAQLRHPSYNFPAAFYDRLKPALQLATIWLDRAKPFFVSIHRAPIIHRSGKTYLDHTYIPNDFDFELYNQLEHYLAENLLIFHLEALVPGASVSLGITTAMRDVNPAKPCEYQAIIGICKEIIANIGMPDFWTKPRKQREAQWAYLAMLLIHELSHAIWFTRNFEDRNLYSRWEDWALRPEPIIPPLEFSELGHTLGTVLFGGDPCLPWYQSNTHFTLPTFNGLGGLREDFFDYRDYRNILTHWRVTAETVHSFFNKLTWTGGSNRPVPEPTMLDMHFLPSGEDERVMPVLHNPREAVGGTGLLPLSSNPTLTEPLTRDEVMKHMGRSYTHRRPVFR